MLHVVVRLLSSFDQSKTRTRLNIATVDDKRRLATLIKLDVDRFVKASP